MATYVGKSDWMKKVLSKLNVYRIAKSFCNKWCKFSQQSIQIIINKIFNHIIQLSRFRYKVQKAKAYTYMSFLLKCHENILNCSTTFLVWLFSMVHIPSGGLIRYHLRPIMRTTIAKIIETAGMANPTSNPISCWT